MKRVGLLFLALLLIAPLPARATLIIKSNAATKFTIRPRALSNVLAGATSPFISNGLIAWYTFDGTSVRSDGSMATILDMSGNANTATTSLVSTLSAPTTGKIGRGWLLSPRVGTANPYLSVASTSASLTDPPGLTISLWYAKGTSSGVTQCLVCKSNPGVVGNRKWALAVRANGLFEFVATSMGGPSAASSVVIADSKWKYLTATWDRTANFSGIHLYVNGVEQSYTGQANGTGVTTDTGTALHINFPGNTNYTAGSIDDVRIYNRVLSPDEVRMLYLSQL